LKVLEDENKKIKEMMGANISQNLAGEYQKSKQIAENNRVAVQFLQSMSGAVGVTVVSEEQDVGYKYTEMQMVHSFYLNGKEIANYYFSNGNAYMTVVENELKEIDKEQSKKSLYVKKENDRKNKINALDKAIEEVENKMVETEKKILDKIDSRGLLSRLFGKKKFYDEINVMKADIEKFKVTKKRLLEERTAYNELVVFVSEKEIEENVKEHNQIVNELKMIKEKNQTLIQERSLLQQKYKSLREEEKQAVKDNENKQKEILEELVNPENGDILQEIANNPKYGEEANEVAKKVLKAAGLGKVKVKI
jgi:hypothetical protein